MISNINDPRIDKSKLVCKCDNCGENMRRMSDWKTSNQAITALFFCKNCEKLVKYSARFKEYYDRIEMRSTVNEIIKTEDS